MNEPIWKLIRNPITGETDVVWRKWDDGCHESCTVTSQQYLKWIEEGNVPTPADE
jgi:hypothetical protein